MSEFTTQEFISFRWLKTRSLTKPISSFQFHNFMVSQSQTKLLFNFLVYIYVYDVNTCYSYIELRIERNFLGFSRYYFSSAKKKKCENHTLKSKNWWVCYVVYFSNSFFCLSEGRQLGPIQVCFSSYSLFLLIPSFFLFPITKNQHLKTV